MYIKRVVQNVSMAFVDADSLLFFLGFFEILRTVRVPLQPALD